MSRLESQVKLGCLGAVAIWAFVIATIYLAYFIVKVVFG